MVFENENGRRERKQAYIIRAGISACVDVQGDSAMSIASSIRGFWDDLFYSALVDRLETDLLMLREDMQRVRQDKDATISELRSEKSFLQTKVSMYELNINRRVGIDPAAKKPEKPSFATFQSPQMKTSWQAEVEEHDAQIEKELEEEAASAAK